MRIKRIGSLILVVLVMAGLTMPLAADGDDGLFPVHMVLDPEVLLPAGDVLAVDPGAPAPGSEAAWQVIKTENFEGPFPNQWRLVGNPTWDREFDNGSHFRHDLAQWTGWCAGGGSAARTPGNLPGGAYAPNMNAWMIYGPFSMQGYAEGMVEFWYWLWGEVRVDYVAWMASADGTNFYGSGDWGGGNKNWRQGSLDLQKVPIWNSLGGKPQVWVAFAFHSDHGLEFKGAYLDDIVIKRKLNSPPTNTGALVPSAGGAPCGTKVFFTAKYYDPNGYADIQAARIHIGRNSAPKSLAGNAVFVYNPANNKVRVRNDKGTAWWGGKPVGTANLVQNSQAIVHLNQTTVKKNGNELEIKWAIEFKCSFRGGKQIFLRTRDRNGMTTPLQQRGNWIVY